MFCMIAYFFIYKKQRAASEGESAALVKGLSLSFNPLWFVIPACFDAISTTLMYIGLVSIDASVMQIINCTILIWIAFFSIIYLKRRYTREQYIGLAALLIGVATAAISAIIKGSGKSVNSSFGVICSVLAMVFGGLSMVSEEKLLSIFNIHPLQVVGIEGTAGFCIFTILLIIFYFIPCTPTKNFCFHGRLEDTPRAFMEIGSNNFLLSMVILATISLGFFNYFGVSLTKYASATHRGAANGVRPFIVWIFCLIAGWEEFTLIQLIGYLIAVYGMLLYYGIIPLVLCPKKGGEVIIINDTN